MGSSLPSGCGFYVGLTQGRGWSHERTIDWLASTVPGLLFES